MKKITAFLLAALLSVSVLSGCGTPADKAETKSSVSETESVKAAEDSQKEDGTETGESKESSTAAPVDVRVMALKGPTAMGMVKMMDDAEAGKLTNENYNFTIAASVDEVTPKLVKGEADIAAVPANLASVLYNNTEGGVQVLAINTLGVLYIAENGDTIQSVKDLAGKTIYASGKGATPEYVLNYILSANGLDPQKDVTIEWKSEHSECVAAMTKDDTAIAMLPQPFLTTAQTKNENIRAALDLTEEWEKVQENADEKSSLLTGVVVVRTDFAKENPEAVADFLDHYKASVEFVNSDVDTGAALVGKYDIVPEPVAKKAIPECNIVYIDGADMKAQLSGYLSVLMEQNAKAVGGQLPGDDFYYSR
ncbi:MAG: PhnD/SsuA/transferrin family substrate-binding protein [Catenibacillus sp.]|nr:PhnD/SsuA/transferrin family substrate-binding protein [Catenibacillus sp.]